MSIANELSRLLQAKSDLATSIENKGVTVPAATTIDGYAALVDQIQQGGGTLPYDAEVGYLITDGSAYINTGIDGKQLLIVSITMARAEDTGSRMNAFFGFWHDTSSYTGLIQLLTQSNKIVAPSGRNSFTLVGISSSTTLVQDTFYSFTITQTKVTTTDRPAYIFCRNNGTPNLFNTHLKIKRVSMTRNNTLVRDFIPVRVGQVGCMYDRVSGQLFENANSTGAFILGPDIT